MDDAYKLVNEFGQVNRTELERMAEYARERPTMIPGSGSQLETTIGTIYTPKATSFTLTVDTVNPGTGDVTLSISNVNTLEVDQGSGLRLTQDGMGGPAKLGAQDASKNHSGVVNLTTQTFRGSKMGINGVWVCGGLRDLGFNPADITYPALQLTADPDSIGTTGPCILGRSSGTVAHLSLTFDPPNGRIVLLGGAKPNKYSVGTLIGGQPFIADGISQTINFPKTTGSIIVTGGLITTVI